MTLTGTALASAELYDPATGTWAATGAMQFGRTSHASSTLTSGDVLVTGGSPSPSFATVESYRPFTGTWARKADMVSGRQSHASIVLTDGRLLISGGLASTSSYLASAEVFNPKLSTWTPVSAMGTARVAHTLNLLPSGKVLAVGGSSSAGVQTASAEMFEPSVNTWTSTASMVAPRSFHSGTTLEDGKVLVVGGISSGSVLGSAEIFSLATQSWTSSSTTLVARESHAAARLRNGDILITGGTNAGVYQGSTEIYQTRNGTNTWVTSVSLQTPRSRHTATPLPDGRVLVAGGATASPTLQYLASSELFSDGAPTDFCTGGGYIRGSVANAPASVELTSPVVSGWAHWGHPNTTSYNRDNGEGPFISNATITTPGAAVTVAPGATAFHWWNGTPLEDASTASGLVVTGTGQSLNAGVSFTAPAGLAARKLKLYAGAAKPSTLRLSLPGTNCGQVQIPITSENVEVSLQYAGTAEGQSLQVSLFAAGCPSFFCNPRVFLRAATMQTDDERTFMDVTGVDPTTVNGLQSETSIAVSSAPHQGIVIGYNDDLNDNMTIRYSVSSRKVYRGASLMGWSWANEPTGPWIHSHLAPSAAWPMLWGDPATTASRVNPNVMYLANLAMSETQFNALQNSEDASISGGMSGNLDGACIARSIDSGRTFSHWFCGTNQGHFWDGSSMEASLGGSVYAAFWDYDDKQIDVLRAPSDDDAQFTLMPRPFPGKTILTHPRLRYDLVTNRLYVAALDAANVLWASYWDGTAWSAPASIGLGYAIMTDKVAFGARNVRIGPTFSFDLGGVNLVDDAVRFFFVKKVGSLFKLDSRLCSQNLTNCTVGPWNLDRAGEDAFQPVVRATPAPADGDWLLSWYARAGAFVYRDKMVIHPRKAGSGGYPTAMGIVSRSDLNLQLSSAARIEGHRARSDRLC